MGRGVGSTIMRNDGGMIEGRGSGIGGGGGGGGEMGVRSGVWEGNGRGEGTWGGNGSGEGEWE